MKIKTLLKAANIEFLNLGLNSGDYWHFLLENFDLPKLPELPKSADHDLANPPLNQRLKRVAVTDISKWLRDPYYIYAKRILELKALDKIDEEASFKAFGNFVHKVLEQVLKDNENIPNHKLEDIINIYGKKYFEQYFSSPESYLLWWPRFQNIANWFSENENKIKSGLKLVITEEQGQIVIDGLKITTKIDRINIDRENNLTIIDYKTGLVPQLSEVRKGLEPQLALEALIFLNLKKLNLTNLKNLQYYSLKGRYQNKIIDIGKKNDGPNDVQNLVEASEKGVKQLINIFNNQKTPFYKAPNPEIYQQNDYCHLARIDSIY